MQTFFRTLRLILWPDHALPLTLPKYKSIEILHIRRHSYFLPMCLVQQLINLKLYMEVTLAHEGALNIA